MKRLATAPAAALLISFELIQFIPYGHDHANPPATAEPQWDRPLTRSLAQAACFDCHSDQTVWPWYSNIAPVSWLVYHDVTEGRQHKFSDWNRPAPQHADEFQKVYEESSMPPWYDALLHPAAQVSDGEKQQLLPGWRSWRRATGIEAANLAWRQSRKPPSAPSQSRAAFVPGPGGPPPVLRASSPVN